MKILLVGAVDGSKTAFDALVNSGIAPTHVLTLPLDKANRHSDYVDLAGPASRIGAEVIHSCDINDEGTLRKIESIRPDLCLVLGWSQICHARFRAIARLGNIGFHPAPLPKLRGRAVIPWTILLGLKETAASLFWLDEGVDSGDILVQQKIAISETETAQTLYQKQTDALATMLPSAVKSVLDGTASRTVQDHSKASYCAKRTPEDGKINWNDSAAKIERFVRAVGTPYPGAFTNTQGGRLWVDKAQFPANPVEYIGIPGQVQAIKKGGFLVLCGDYKCLEVQNWRSPNDIVPHQHSILGQESQS